MIPETSLKTRNIVGLESYSYVQPANHVPKIQSSDYEYGYITRYFVSNINYNNAYETNARDFNVVNTNFYKKLKITWKISGPEFNLYDGKMLLTTGVVDYNILRINEAAQVFSEIYTILDNPRQYWRGF